MPQVHSVLCCCVLTEQAGRDQGRGRVSQKCYPTQRRKWLCYTLNLGENKHKKNVVCFSIIWNKDENIYIFNSFGLLTKKKKYSLMFPCNKIIDQKSRCKYVIVTLWLNWSSQSITYCLCNAAAVLIESGELLNLFFNPFSPVSSSVTRETQRTCSGRATKIHSFYKRHL